MYGRLGRIARHSVWVRFRPATWQAKRSHAPTSSGHCAASARYSISSRPLGSNTGTVMTPGRDGNEPPSCARDCVFQSVVDSSVDETASSLLSGEKDMAATLALAAWSGGAACVPRRALHKSASPFSVPTASVRESDA